MVILILTVIGVFIFAIFDSSNMSKMYEFDERSEAPIDYFGECVRIKVTMRGEPS